MTYDNWKTRSPDDEYEPSDTERAEHAAELEAEADWRRQQAAYDESVAALIPLEQVAYPSTAPRDIEAALARGDRARLAIREVYRYVDELDDAMRETGVCPVGPIEIIDRVKLLLTRVHT